MVEGMTTKQSGAKKSENYRYAVKRLPDDVVKEACRFSVSNNYFVIQRNCWIVQ